MWQEIFSETVRHAQILKVRILRLFYKKKVTLKEKHCAFVTDAGILCDNASMPILRTHQKKMHPLHKFVNVDTTKRIKRNLFYLSTCHDMW
jgi:hypothetical protein